MGTVEPADNNQSLTHHRRLIQALVSLSAGVFAVQITRTSMKVLSPWLSISEELRPWLYLIPLIAYFAVNLFMVKRIKDRFMLAIYIPTAFLLLSTHVIAVTPYQAQVPRLLVTAADAIALGLLIGVLLRSALLLIRSYRQRHEYILANLALGTSHRVGEDFLTGMVESISRALDVDLVLVTEARPDDTAESVVAAARREDLALCRLVDPGSALDCSQESLESLAPGREVTVMSLTDTDGASCGHLILLHKPRTITIGHRYSLQIFASRASAELQRLKTDRKNRELQHQVQLSQKMESLGVLASGLAHDFNNVLQAIRGYSAMAADTAMPESERIDASSRVEHVVNNAAELCNRLLAYAGKSMRRNTICSINQIVRDSTEIVQAARPERTITLQLTDEPLAVEGDSAQLIQVIMNLLTNAVDSVEESGGDILVRTEKMARHDLSGRGLKLTTDGDFAVVHVTDEGCGIPADDEDRIFDPYFTTKGDGRGIGLAAVAGIVKSHAGDITFESELNVGTTFSLALPITTAEARDAPPPAAQQTQLQGLSVLLVDDDDQVRTSVEMMLRTAGIQVTAAASGRECLEIVEDRGEQFALILIDQTMPGSSGLETCQLLRERGFNRPVILMSGYSEVAIDEELHQVRFLAKPCSRLKLIEAVAEVASPSDDRPTPARHSA